MTISRAAVAGIVSAFLIGSGVGEPPNTAQGHGARHHSPSVVGALSGGDVSDAPEGIPVEVVEQVAADMGVSPELAEAHLIWQADFERLESRLRESYPETYGGGFISGPMTGTIYFVKGAQWDRTSIGLEGVTVSGRVEADETRGGGALPKKDGRVHCSASFVGVKNGIKGITTAMHCLLTDTPWYRQYAGSSWDYTHSRSWYRGYYGDFGFFATDAPEIDT